MSGLIYTTLEELKKIAKNNGISRAGTMGEAKLLSKLEEAGVSVEKAEQEPGEVDSISSQVVGETETITDGNAGEIIEQEPEDVENTEAEEESEEPELTEQEQLKLRSDAITKLITEKKKEIDELTEELIEVNKEIHDKKEKLPLSELLKRSRTRHSVSVEIVKERSRLIRQANAKKQTAQELYDLSKKRR